MISTENITVLAQLGFSQRSLLSLIVSMVHVSATKHMLKNCHEAERGDVRASFKIYFGGVCALTWMLNNVKMYLRTFCTIPFVNTYCSNSLVD